MTDLYVSTPQGQPVPSPTERWAAQESDRQGPITLNSAGGDPAIYAKMKAEAKRKAEAANQKYVAKLESLIAKYGIDKTKLNFDNVTNTFRATPKPAQAMAVASKN